MDASQACWLQQRSANGHPLNEQMNSAGALLKSWWRLPCRQTVWQTEDRWTHRAVLLVASDREVRTEEQVGDGHQEWFCQGPGVVRIIVRIRTLEERNTNMELLISLTYGFFRNGIGSVPNWFWSGFGHKQCVIVIQVKQVSYLKTHQGAYQTFDISISITTQHKKWFPICHSSLPHFPSFWHFN